MRGRDHHVAGTGSFRAAARRRSRNPAASIRAGCRRLQLRPDTASRQFSRLLYSVLAMAPLETGASGHCPGPKDRHSWAVAVPFAFVPWRLGRASGHFYGTHRFAMMQNVKCPLTGTTGADLPRALPQVPSECCGLHGPTPGRRHQRIPFALATHGLLAPLCLVGGAHAATAVLDRYVGSFVASGTISGGTKCRFSSGPLPFHRTRQSAMGLSSAARAGLI